jgi:hypothetical protein
VEADYQRNLTAGSIKLIRSITADFNWLHIKPVICAKGRDGKLVVLDGQHTAIAAISRGIKSVPIMLVNAPEMRTRARAFVAQNMNRLSMSALQVFHAKLAAEEPTAIAAAKVAKAAGVAIVRSQPASGSWQVGDTMAAAAIERLTAKRGVEKATKILKLLVDAKRAPVVVHEILAAAAVLYEPAFGWSFSSFNLVTVVRSKSVDEWRGIVMAKVGKENRTALWKGVAEAWVNAGKKRT